MVHPKATNDIVAAADKRDFDGEDERKVAYIKDQLQRGTGKDKRPIREEADVRMLTDTLTQLVKRHDRFQQKEATHA